MKAPFLFRPYFRASAFLFFAAFAIPRANASSHNGQVTQVILFSLKRPGNVDDQNLVLRASRQFRRARGVVDFRVGRPLQSDPSADFAVVVTFKDRNAFERFVGDQRRQQNTDALMRPLVRRYSVYNFANE